MNTPLGIWCRSRPPCRILCIGAISVLQYSTELPELAIIKVAFFVELTDPQPSPHPLDKPRPCRPGAVPERPGRGTGTSSAVGFKTGRAEVEVIHEQRKWLIKNSLCLSNKFNLTLKEEL